jgi:hypothetical protein
VALVSTATQAPGNIVSAGLITKVIALLTDVMGPIAPFVVRDQIRGLNESQEKFPQAKLEELIGLVSREVSDAKLRSEFEAAVAREIVNFKRS